jgi:predicted transcriptional regulator
VIENTVNQSTGGVSRGRVDNHAGRFVDHQEIGILEKNIQIQGFGH